MEHEGLGSAKGLMVVECPQSIESAVLEASHLEVDLTPGEQGVPFLPGVGLGGGVCLTSRAGRQGCSRETREEDHKPLLRARIKGETGGG